MYNVKDGIAVPTAHSYSTSLKFRLNTIVPKMRTVFRQQCPKYKFIQFGYKCYNHDV